MRTTGKLGYVPLIEWVLFLCSVLIPERKVTMETLTCQFELIMFIIVSISLPDSISQALLENMFLLP